MSKNNGKFSSGWLGKFGLSQDRDNIVRHGCGKFWGRVDRHSGVVSDSWGNYKGRVSGRGSYRR